MAVVVVAKPKSPAAKAKGCAQYIVQAEDQYYVGEVLCFRITRIEAKAHNPKSQSKREEATHCDIPVAIEKAKQADLKKVASALRSHGIKIEKYSTLTREQLLPEVRKRITFAEYTEPTEEEQKPESEQDSASEQ